MNEDKLTEAADQYSCGLRELDKKNVYDNIEVDSARITAFKNGARWQAEQSPWISVEMAIPRDNSPGVVQVRDVYGKEWEIAACRVMYNIYPYIKTGYVTHWRVINE